MKVKIALVCLISLLAVPLLGCQLFDMVGSFTSPAALTREQAIVVVQVSGLPRIDEYYQESLGDAAQGVEIGHVTPGAQWSTEYQRRERTWTVQGTVITQQWGECLSTWTINEATSELTLIGFNCD
jgi:hypothetical protein